MLLCMKRMLHCGLFQALHHVVKIALTGMVQPFSWYWIQIQSKEKGRLVALLWANFLSVGFKPIHGNPNLHKGDLWSDVRELSDPFIEARIRSLHWESPTCIGTRQEPPNAFNIIVIFCNSRPYVQMLSYNLNCVLCAPRTCLAKPFLIISVADWMLSLKNLLDMQLLM